MKRNSINYLPLFLLFISSFLCAGCIKIPDEKVEITLSVSQNSLNFTSSVGSQRFEVNSNDKWYVNTEASWITVSQGYRNNSETVTVTVERNTSSTPRNATIVVRSYVSEVSAQNISVTQAGITTLSVSPNSLYFAYSAASQTFTINSNDGWNVSKEASWLTVSPSSGNNSGTVTVTVNSNTSSSSRNATITVRSNDSGVSAQNISVTQAGAPTAQVRFRKDGAYSLYTYMGVENYSTGSLVAYYNFGSGSGNSSYYSVTAGTYVPTVYRTDNGWTHFHFTADGSLYTVYLSAGYRYTIMLYYDSSGYHLSLNNDGIF